MLISRDNASIETNINPTLPFCGSDLVFQTIDGCCWRYSIQRHINDRGHASKCSGLCASIEALPFRPSGFVEMYMGINKSRENDMWRVIDIGRTRIEIRARQYGMKDRRNLSGSKGYYDSGCCKAT